MLKKILLSIAMVFISFLTGYATAQSYFINNAPVATTISDQSNTTQNSGDFQSQTQQLEDKKKQALSDQLKQDLAKVPPTPAPSVPAPATPEGAAPEAGQAAAPESNQPAAAATPSAQAPIQETAPSGPTPAAPPATPPSQSQVYTGFQNQDKDKNSSQTPPAGTNQSAPSSSGGWNIKY